MTPSLKRSLLSITLGAFLIAGMPAGAFAAMIGTDTALTADSGSARAATLARVQAGLARADVRAQLVKFGVNPDEAATRAAALDDQDLNLLAHQFDTLPAGGDFGIFVVLGVVFLVLIILDYVGATHIFSHHH